MRPDFGHVEDVPSISLCLSWIHDLNIDIPHRIIFSLNGLERIPYQVIRIFTCDLGCFLLSENFDSLLSLDVDLDVFECSLEQRVVLFSSS